MSTEDTVRDLRSRLAKAASDKARAEAEHERAVADKEAALAALAEFGVKTAEEASALLAKLETDLAAELAAVETALSEAGA